MPQLLSSPGGIHPRGGFDFARSAWASAQDTAALLEEKAAPFALQAHVFSWRELRQQLKGAAGRVLRQAALSAARRSRWPGTAHPAFARGLAASDATPSCCKLAGTNPRSPHGSGLKPEVKHAIQLVKRNPHLEPGARAAAQPGPARFLHDGQAVQIEPAAGLRVDALDRFFLLRLGPGAAGPRGFR